MTMITLDFILIYKKWLDNHIISSLQHSGFHFVKKKNRKQVVFKFSSLSIAYVIQN